VAWWNRLGPAEASPRELYGAGGRQGRAGATALAVARELVTLMATGNHRSAAAVRASPIHAVREFISAGLAKLLATLAGTVGIGGKFRDRAVAIATSARLASGVRGQGRHGQEQSSG